MPGLLHNEYNLHPTLFGDFKMQFKVFSSHVFHYAMGLQSLDVQTWIDRDDQWQEDLHLKEQLVRSQRAKVFQALPEAEDASLQLLLLLAEHIAHVYPTHFSFKMNRLLVNATQREYNLANLEDHPLLIAAQWVQEDFCLMRTESKEARLIAGCVCFPSRWRLIEKIGKNMAGIHQPVPGFNQLLESPATRFLLNTTESKPMWRVNWSLHDSNELFADPPSSSHKKYREDEVLSATFLRIERQVFRKLKDRPVVVFSIRTYIRSMQEVARDLEMRDALRGQIQTMSDEVAAYKGLKELRVPLIKALS